MKIEAASVAEIQGLYGAYSFPEKLLQKIWLRGDFDRTRAMTTDGRAVRVVHPGQWNLLGGPDFRGARLVIGEGGREIVGDVEVHLRTVDWDAHAHARDRAYDGVILHVVLFPPDRGQVTRGADGREIPVLALLSLLQHDLEEYATEEAVESLANRPTARLSEELALLPASEALATVQRHAEARWRQKVHFARLRVQRLGWEAACHHTALEILGYRFNRAPMLRIAGRWPLTAWAKGEVDVEAAYAAEEGSWSVQGVRPANRPRTRLGQYAEWTGARPDWPARVKALVGELARVKVQEGISTKEVRRAYGFTALREQWVEEICAGTMGGTRFDNLVCDGLLPLVATHTGADLRGIWMHWFAGDVPPFIASALRQAGFADGKSQPMTHGLAQGLLGWMIDRDGRK